MSERKPSMTVYLDQPLKDEVEELRVHLSRDSLTLKKTQVVEMALREFVKRYRNDKDQFKLDFSPKL